MGLTFFVVTAGVAIAGYIGYQKLKKVEEEVRREMKETAPVKGPEAPVSEEGRKAPEEAGPAAPQPVPRRVEIAPAREKPAAKRAEPAGAEAPESMEERLLKEIRDTPGILQTELYGRFSGEDRKALQAALLKMAKDGRVKRTKEGSTYKLRPGK